MDEIQIHEFDALRQTIRARGTARPFAFLAGLIGWAALLVAVLGWLPNPLAATLPLIVLASTFEVVRTLHLGVERIGRYVQVFFEPRETGEAPPPTRAHVDFGSASPVGSVGLPASSGRDAPLVPPAWETTATAFGGSVPGAGGHPFFLPIFVMATLLNYLAVIFPGPVAVELWTLAIPHIALVLWMLYCDRAMRKQRATELARYRELKTGSR